MSQQAAATPTREPGAPSAPTIARVRRLIVVAALAAFGYGAFTTGSAGYCPGGVTGDGRFLDADGKATEAVPSCVNLTLQPSGLIYVAIVALVIGALTMVLRRATDERSAIRYLDRAAAVIVILAVVSIVISVVWMRMIPITDWDGAGTFFSPFPFGSIDVNISPMTTQ